jgi:GNAT superfamily N-acetyltransferase
MTKRPKHATVGAGEIVVTLEPEPADEVRGAAWAGLGTHNRVHVDPPDFQSLVLAARDRDGQIVGALAGETAWQWLHVVSLWVDEAHRGRGLGRRLLRTAEDEARKRGVLRVYLDTLDFQARPFYEREGYVVFAVQEDYPPGHQRFYMRKELEGWGTS